LSANASTSVGAGEYAISEQGFLGIEIDIMEKKLTHQYTVEVDGEIVDVILNCGLLPPNAPLGILGNSTVDGFDGFAIGRLE